jgi:ribosomal protein S25
MGGKKKLSLKQMQKMQERRNKKQEPKSRRNIRTDRRREEGRIALPDFRSDKVMGELKKMKAITPHGIATNLDLRLSTARRFLGQLENKGIIRFVSGNRNIKIYQISEKL